MPRAFCSQCGAEVPVDPEGRCHLGHEVDLGSAGSTLEVELDTGEAVEGDEPEPWVASVDEPTGGDPTPSHQGGGPAPGTSDDTDLSDIDAVGRDAGRDLPPAQQPAATSPSQTYAWRPPTADPAGPGPQPPPVPVDPPDEPGDDFDLDDLEAAVAELEGVGTSAEPAAAPEPDHSDEPPARPWETSPPPPPDAVDDGDEPDRDLDEPGRDDDGDTDDPAPTPADDRGGQVDLGSFTASGDTVEDGGGGGRRRRFGFGR